MTIRLRAEALEEPQRMLLTAALAPLAVMPLLPLQIGVIRCRWWCWWWYWRCFCSCNERGCYGLANMSPLQCRACGR